MVAGIETFANQPVGTVTAGGTTNSDTAFTVTATDTWPAASSTTIPNTFFRITDQANTSEIMLVTVAPGGSGAGQSWTVTRGAEGTTAISHAANWTCVQLVTAGTLENFKQASNATTTPVTIASSTETLVASYQPVTVDIEMGTTFEVVAYGTFTTNNTIATNRQMVWTVRWGGTAGTILSQLKTNSNAPTMTTSVAAGSSFDLNATVTLLNTTQATCNMNLFCNAATLIATQQTATVTNATGGAASSSTPVTISGNGPLVLDFNWGGAVTTQTLTAVSPLIYRAA